VSDDQTTVAQLRELLRVFVAEREWHRFHDPKNLAMSIAIEAGELMEHFQWVRSEALDDALRDPRRQAEIREELADVLAYVLALSNALDLDLADALRDKMRKNAAKYPAAEYRGWYEKPRDGA
jgi:NTP pyrophosphatase (non-canonical NTP hydrolase)